MYTDDRNAQIVLALLKKYNIKKIVVSPGMTNVPIAMSVQKDPFFEVYSVVDERSAAYFATGLSHESGEPVVISCTGATASRNYLPALTEAYYRNLPIIALTSQHHTSDYSNYVPQITNRTVSQLDIKRISVNLPFIKDKEDEEGCVLSVNKALTLATKKGCCPVHINLMVNTYSFNTKNLPDVQKIEYYQTVDFLSNDFISLLKKQLYGKKIGLLIGSHRKFSKDEADAIDNFINTYDVTVFYDHTSNYHGKNKVLISSFCDLKHINLKPDIMIDIGGIIGDYSAVALKGPEFWRVSEDGEFRQRLGNLYKQFDCPEYIFFNSLADKTQIKTSLNSYYNAVMERVGEVIIPDLPLSNTFISSQMAKKLPSGCSLHLGILNSLRNMDFFELHDSIDCSCNVGGFGIDGAVSTLIGQSMVNKNKLYFGQVGDLAFFYDMNALGIRHIGNNIRLLLVNNGKGVEFRVNPGIEKPFGNELDEFIAAAGHYGSAKAWAQSMGFEYLTANNKDKFLKEIDSFCSPDISRFIKPVLFEVFTTVEDEQKGLSLIHDSNKTIADIIEKKAKGIVKQVLPKKAIDALKKIRK